MSAVITDDDLSPDPVWRTRLWPVGVFYSALALLAVFSNATGRYIGDNRFEQYVNPARRLAKSLGVWDPTRGLGAPREESWPGTTIPVAVFRSLGMSSWASERMFHAICLVTMALGVTAMMRLFRPRVGIEHLVAGLYAGFGPYSSAFLVPTNLYFMMALGPWLVVTLVKGVTTDRPWRWAAVFALMVAWAGNPDPPGLIYNAIIIALAAIYLVHVERATRWRDVVRWSSAAVGLALLCSLWTLSKTFYARDMLNARLVDTELPAVSALTSSSSESLRGLGNWLSYFREGGILLKPQGSAFFTNAFVVAATFVVPVVALVALWRVKWRAKVMFATMALVSLAVVVSAFASPTASPIGAVILWMMEHITFISSFRNTYKAGGGIAIGVGVLAGIGVARARDLLAHDRRWRRAPAVMSTVVLLGVSFPFWTNTLYHPFQQVDSVPSYWSQTFAYLDGLPSGGLTAVVPAITRADYRWGWVGDDIFDALLARPHAIATGVPLSSPLGANALETFTQATQVVPYRQGVAGSLARRLGITEVVIRNDVRWEVQNLPRPSTYDGLRHDPDFQLVATFGQPGTSVVADTDHSNASLLEKRLPPVEVYRLRSPGASARAVATAPVMLVGDSYSWPAIEQQSLVGTYQPLVNSGAVPDVDIVSIVRQSKGVLVTDSARRRLRRLISYEPAYSFTLGRQQDAGRIVRELFPAVPSAEATTWYPDASDISPVGVEVSQTIPAFRPALAFDGDPTTAWAANWGLSPDTPGLKITFRHQTTVSDIDLTALSNLDGVSSVQRIEAVLSDGSRQFVYVSRNGTAHFDFPATSTMSLTLLLSGIDVRQGLVGLSEVVIPGVDLREFIEPGTDLFGGRAGLLGLDALTSTLPTAYSFARAWRTSYQVDPRTMASRYDEDHTIRRRFVVDRAGDYRVSGTLRLTGNAAGAAVDALVGGDVSATASSSDPTDLEGQPMHAIDGSTASAWIGSRPIHEALTVTVPQQRVQRVEVVAEIDDAASPISVVTVSVGSAEYSRLMVGDSSCPAVTLAELAEQNAREFALQIVRNAFSPGTPAPVKPPCYRRAIVDLPTPVLTSHVTVTIDAQERRANPFGTKAHLNEVRISGPDRSAAQNTVDTAAPVGGDCRDIGLRVADSSGLGAGVPVPVSFHATVADLLAGHPIPFTACAPVHVEQGVSYLDAGRSRLIDSVDLTTPDWPALTPQVSTPTQITVAYQGSDVATARVSLVDRSMVVFGQSFDPLWTLSVDGAAPQAAVAVDGLDGWPVSAGEHELTFRYQGVGPESVAIVVSLLFVAICIALVIGRRRRPALAVCEVDLSDDDVEVASVSRRRSTIAVIAATVIGATLVGFWAIIVGVVVLAVVHFFDDPVEVTGSAAPLLLALAGGASVLALYTGASSLWLLYPKDRSLSHHLTVMAMVFAVQSVALLSIGARAAHDRRLLLTRRDVRALEAGARRAVVRHWQVAAVAVAGIAIALLTSIYSVDSSGLEQLVRNIRLGTKYSTGVYSGPTAVDLAPLAPTVRATVHLAPAVLGAITFLFTLVVVVRWARRRVPGVDARWVAAACVVSPLSWGLGLGAQLAALAVVCAGSLLDSPHRSTGHLVAGGIAMGAAVLARPDAVLLVVVVVVLMVVRGQRRDALLFGGVALVTSAPWINTVWSAGEAPWLAGSLRTMFIDVSTSGVERWTTWWIALLVVGVAVKALARRDHSPASEQ